MDRKREAIADRIGGIFWIAFGLTILVYSSRMGIPRHLGATFLSGPGFVPMLLGGALSLLGLVLLLRSLRGRLLAFLEHGAGASDKRALAALALMLAYALGLVGRVPFALATFLFIAAFIALFNLPARGARLAGLLAKASATAAVTTAVVVFVFQELFYVRLP